MTPDRQPTWDIFCRVIDNYGDIGVCWRLARQLANEYPLRVRLWVDDLTALTRIWPNATTAPQQWLDKVDVRSWGEHFAGVEAGDVVIEAFACELSADYLAAMKGRATPPCWINLEYLSAESWVEDCHGMQSIHPSLGLKKTFFFPGFTAKTGGLLREAGLLDERERFLANGEKSRLLQELSIPQRPQSLLISLFGYENPAVGSLLDAWQAGYQPVTCVVPAGKILASVNAHWSSALAAGDCVELGALTLAVIPFLSQQQYDQLLWACDLNFVRGEDSFVRAQWAAKPLIWHIYSQEEDAHLDKLDAFLTRYTQGLPESQIEAITDLWHRWNQGQDCTDAWTQWLGNYPNWLSHSKDWCQRQDLLGNLAANLTHFCEKNL